MFTCPTDAAVVGRAQDVPDSLYPAGLDDPQFKRRSVGHVLCLTYCSPAEFAVIEKKLTGSVDERRALVEPTHPDLSILSGNVTWWGWPRVAITIKPAPAKPEDLHLMRLLDEQYFTDPLLWQPPDDGVAPAAGLWGKSQTGTVINAVDGIGWHCPWPGASPSSVTVIKAPSLPVPPSPRGSSRPRCGSAWVIVHFPLSSVHGKL